MMILSKLIGAIVGFAVLYFAVLWAATGLYAPIKGETASYSVDTGEAAAAEPAAAEPVADTATAEPAAEPAAAEPAAAPAVEPAVAAVEPAAPAPEADTAAVAPAVEPVAVAPAAAMDPAFAALFAAADIAAGKKTFAKCKTCHKIDGKNAVGPHLNGVVNRARASVEGFAYSAALIKLQGDTWTPENMFAYLENPKAYAPGNKMAFPGLPKPEDRVNVIAYLATQP